MTRLLTLPLCALAAACAAPDLSEAFYRAEVQVADEVQGAHGPALDLIRSANTSLQVGFQAGEDLELAQAVVDAFDRGVDVEVVTDIDQQADPGIAALLQAGVPVALLDGGLAFFDFGVNLDVAWTSEQTVMSHGYVIADRQQAQVSTHFGRTGPGARVVFDLAGEELMEDLLSEHNQLMAGVDATATTAFSGLAKSIVDPRWVYPTQTDVMLEVWFGPQQRLMKRLTDAVYAARGSVRLVTDDLAHEGLIRILEQKAGDGLDVSVIVGPNFGSVAPQTSDLLRASTALDRRRLTEPGLVPTVLLVDLDRDRSGARNLARALVVTHDALSGERYYRYEQNRIEEFEPTLTDQFTDGMLLGFRDDDEPSAELRALATLMDDLAARAEAF